MIQTEQPDDLDRFLRSSQRDALRAPIETATTFPATAYTSDDFFRLEIDRVFRRNWVALCFSTELGQAGDVRPFDEFGLPLMATRGTDGTVNVFHNVCPYDGCPVVTEARSGAERLRVSYHGWEYDLSGILRLAPSWDGTGSNDPAAAPPGRRDLSRVASQEYLGVVFVALSAEVVPFDEVRRSLEEVLRDYDLDAVAPALDAQGRPRVDHDPAIGTNWKTFAENDCLNILHESFVHPVYERSTAVPRVDPAGVATFRVEHDGRVLGFSYLDADVTGIYPEPDLPPLSPDGSTRPERGHFLQIFPNLSLMVRPNYIAPLILFPRTASCVSISTTMLVRDTAAPGGSERLADVQAMLDAAGAEDAHVIESIQRHRHSPAAGNNFYAPFWDQPHYLFNRMALDDLELRT